jgi:methionyl aminopeptidase
MSNSASAVALDTTLYQRIYKTDEGNIYIHTPEAFEGMRVAGKLAAQTLDFIAPHVVAGITTAEIDRLCHDFITQRGGICAPLGYKGFPKSVCTSVNQVICHGIPDEKTILKQGDIINIDVTPTVDGWHGDSSRTFFVGKVSVMARRLVEVTYECLMRGIDVVKPGATTGDIGYVIQTHAEKMGYSIVRDFCGHGLGKIFHTAPNIMHFGVKGKGIRLEEGMFFTIEPMLNVGKPDARMLEDGWTSVTRDRSLSAQFEHSLGVTADGCEIFTVR